MFEQIEQSLRQIKSSMAMEERQVKLRRARSPLHIMVIDDDVVTQELMQRLLGANYCVTVCSSVSEGLQEYLRVTPDLVFLDINLGDAEFSGFDVAHTICMYDDDANIVIITGNESAQNIAHARRAGASGFIAKPFSPSRILHYVQECEREKFSRD